MKDDRERKTGFSLAEVATAAGVSKMTVSRVLRGGDGFSAETRERVLREVDRLGYVPNRLAAAFGAPGTSNLIGVCVPRLTGGLFGEVLENIDRTLARLGYQTMIGIHDQQPADEELWLRSLLSWRPAGVILSGRNHTAGTIELLKGAAVPVVEIWDLNTSPIDISVGFNHFDCGFEMAQFMLGRGRRRFGYVGALKGTASMGSLRFKGFCKAIEAAGQEVIASEILHDRPSFYGGFYGLETLLNRTPDIDAVYFHDDAMAIGGMAYCRANDIDVPGTIAIAGWGGMEAASILPLRLTTTMVSTQALGKHAAEALVSRLRTEPCKDVIVVPTRLVPGATV